MRVIILVLIFLAAGVCILVAATMAALRLPHRAIRPLLVLGHRLTDLARKRAHTLFGTGRYM